MPWDFPCDYLKQTAITLAKKNKVFAFHIYEGITLFSLIFRPKKRALFFKNLPRRKNFLRFIPVYLLPFHRWQAIQKINYWFSIQQFKLFIKFKTEKKQPILWLFSPELVFLTGEFKEKVLLYDCVDFYSSLNKKANQVKKKEKKELLNKADFVFTNSPALFNLFKNKHLQVFQVPQGCNLNIFLKTKKLKTKKNYSLNKSKKIPQPRIGFVGNIDHRLDFQLIKTLAKRNPSWSFVFVGPVYKDKLQAKKTNLNKNIRKLKKIKNIYFLPKIEKEKIPSIIDIFDCCLIPYDIEQQFNLYSYPMKVFEYFARGKPIVSTPIKSLIPLQPYLKIAGNANQFEKEIKKILKNCWSKKYIREQKKLAKANSWQAKIEEISKILKSLLFNQ